MQNSFLKVLGFLWAFLSGSTNVLKSATIHTLYQTQLDNTEGIQKVGYFPQPYGLVQ